MIYISTGAVKTKRIASSVELMARSGIKNIELSGGTDPYIELEADLLLLRQKYGLNYLCHNYFPPPKEPFILNLCSRNIDIYRKSIFQAINAIILSSLLGADKYAIHAGFFFDIPLRQIGKKIDALPLYDRNIAIENFCETMEIIDKFAGKFGVKLYIENNVLSNENYQTFGKEKPFMLLDSEDYYELKKWMDFDLLLDVGHLKVSCQSLGLDFKSELDKLLPETDYIHISDNSGFADENKIPEEDSELIHLMSNHHLKNKTITLESYDSLDNLKNAVYSLERTFNL